MRKNCFFQQPSGEGEQLDLRIADPAELCIAQFVVLGTEHSIVKQTKFAMDKEPFGELFFSFKILKKII